MWKERFAKDVAYELNFEEHMCGGDKSRELVQRFGGFGHVALGRYMKPDLVGPQGKEMRLKCKSKT